jgi:hypothetical protein
MNFEKVLQTISISIITAAILGWCGWITVQIVSHCERMAVLERLSVEHEKQIGILHKRIGRAEDTD